MLKEVTMPKKDSEETKHKHKPPSHKGQIPWNKGTTGLQAGDKHPMFGRHHSEETKKKISERRKESYAKGAWVPPMRGKHIADDIKQKLSDIWKEKYKDGTFVPYWKGKHLSEEHKQKLSILKNEYVPWNKGKNGLYHPTEETKQKQSSGGKGKQAGEKHPNWQGGISFLPYCHKFNKQLKERIRERDNRTCQYPRCGKKENGKKHSCHHVHYDKENCNPDLITLCCGCNIKANSNREYHESVFMNILNERGLLFWKT